LLTIFQELDLSKLSQATIPTIEIKEEDSNMVSTQRSTAARQELPVNDKKKVRIGIVIPEILNKNLKLHCLRVGSSKQEAIIVAIRQLLKQNGIDPDKMAKINLSYG
jgi:hypothetical protein